MRFPPSFLDEIRARVSISSVVGRAVQWDRRKTNAGRGDYWACCPFHNEKSPSFHCEDQKGRYHCFGCKESGDIFTFLVEKEGLSFPEAVERLASDAGLPMPVMSPEAAEREERRATLYDVMEMAAAFFEAKLQAGEGARARGYLSDRSISGAVQQQFRIGYAPSDRYALKSHLADNGVSSQQMTETGLVVSGEDIAVPYDRFRDRVMFPIRDGRGRVIAFGGRALSPDVPAKYLNSPEGPLFHKGAVLYNADQARKAAHDIGKVIAVEGYMDVIAMSRAGFGNAVAPLGTALTEDQLGLLWRMSPEPVLCFDGDQAGIKAAYRALDLALPLLKPGYSLRFVLLPDGQDPDDLLNSEGRDALGSALEGAEAMIDVLWRRALEGNDRSTPEARARLEVDIERAVGAIQDQKVRVHYQQAVRDRLKALWGQSGGAAGRGGRQGRRFVGSRFKKGRFNDRPWDFAAPASPELKALAGKKAQGQASERRERMILLALVNHPGLLDRLAEQFAETSFSSRELDRLRREILDIAALNEGLDSAGLRAQLVARGYGDVLERVDGQAHRLDAWFALADAAEADARTGLGQMLVLHRKAVVLARELKAAEQRLAELPSEENLIQLNEIREELRSATGEEAAIDGFGEASGRGSGNTI